MLDEWTPLATNTCYSYELDESTATNHDDRLSHALEDSVVDLFDRALQLAATNVEEDFQMAPVLAYRQVFLFLWFHCFP